MESINVTTEDVAKQVDEAARTSEEAARVAARGEEATNEAIVKIAEVQQAIETLAQSVEVLGKRSSEIGNIVDVITTIADQTNLLSLNAAIEAARAGESGRGFSVVADEVRKLAEGSGKAAEQIGELIKEVQEETAKAVKYMEIGTREVEVGAEVVGRTGEALRQITDAVARTSALAEQIAHSMQSKLNARVPSTGRCTTSRQSSRRTRHLPRRQRRQPRSRPRAWRRSLRLRRSSRTWPSASRTWCMRSRSTRSASDRWPRTRRQGLRDLPARVGGVRPAHRVRAEHHPLRGADAGAACADGGAGRHEPQGSGDSRRRSVAQVRIVGTCPSSTTTRIVVAEGEAGTVGLAVDAASEVTTIPLDDIKPAPESVLDAETAEAFEGVADREDGIVILLDMDKAVPRADYARLAGESDGRWYGCLRRSSSSTMRRSCG